MRKTAAELARSCRMDKEGQALLRATYTRLGLSARAHSRIINLARTIADLPGAEHIAAEHVGEVLPYWILDRAVKD